MQNIDQRQMLPVGAVLDNRYRIIRYLASGGFGNTYVAEDGRLGGEVAVKEFFMRGTNHRSGDGTTVDVSNIENQALFDSQLGKFKREAARIFKLRNDHIIHVFDLFDANGTSYYVMDLVKGTSLSAVVREHPLPEAEARDVIFQVLDALKTMHANGLYHLDIKPGNIMRDADGHCTLIDFGASKQLTTDERSTYSSSTMAYTPGYAAIEQIAQQTKNIGPWTDLYALGATFYCLLTGNRPPEVDADDTAPDGRKFPYPPEVSEQSRHAIAAMMNPSRRLRPQNADEAIALLDRKVLLNPQIGARKASYNEETQVITSIKDDEKTQILSDGIVKVTTPQYENEKNRSFNWLVIPLVLVLLAGGGFYFFQDNSKPEQNHSSEVVIGNDVTNSPSNPIDDSSKADLEEGSTSDVDRNPSSELDNNSSSVVVSEVENNNDGSMGVTQMNPHSLKGSFYNQKGSWPVEFVIQIDNDGQINGVYKNISQKVNLKVVGQMYSDGSMEINDRNGNLYVNLNKANTREYRGEATSGHTTLQVILEE